MHAVDTGSWLVTDFKAVDSNENAPSKIELKMFPFYYKLLQTKQKEETSSVSSLLRGSMSPKSNVKRITQTGGSSLKQGPSVFPPPLKPFPRRTGHFLVFIICSLYFRPKKLRSENVTGSL